ncbi:MULTISPECIES: hypothetical protein [unclassified Streptomyces]
MTTTWFITGTSQQNCRSTMPLRRRMDCSPALMTTAAMPSTKQSKPSRAL